MKFQPEKLSGQAIVQGYDHSGVVINGVKHTTSMVFGQNLAPVEWQEVSKDEQPDGGIGIKAVHWLEQTCPPDTEVVIIGTGDKQIFPSIEVRRFFIQNKTPVEYMDSHAACRTYNILVGEGRAVVAAIVL